MPPAADYAFGGTFKVSLSVAKFDRFTDLEDQVMDYLASVTDLKVFGCVIDFYKPPRKPTLRTQSGISCSKVKNTPLSSGTQCYPARTRTARRLFHRSSPLGRSCPYEPRSNCPRMGLCRCSTPATRQRRVRNQAHWCRGVARLPATPHCQTAGRVVGIADHAFRDCKLLNSVLAPGCRDFSYKAFSECCSLQRVYASDGAVNVFNGEANFGQYLFQGCINLAEVTFE